MPVIRIRTTDKERIDHMKGYLSTAAFITKLLDEAEQPKKKAKTKHPDFDKIKELYLSYWFEYNKFKYQWNGVIDNTATNRLIKSLDNINESNLSIVDLFTIIMGKLPDFYKDKSINAINKNLNGIIAEIKNGRNKATKLQNGGHFDFRT